MTPCFVFAADLHVEDGAWSTRPGIFGDSYHSLTQIVDYCVTHRLPLVLGGDVLEKKSNSARPIARLCYQMSRMADEKLPVYYIQGNHEYDRNAPWLSVHPWPVHLNKAPYNIRGVTVYGLDWLPRGEIQAAFKDAPARADILVTHQVWDEFMKGLGRIECTLPDVHHVTVILNGDFHPTKEVHGNGAQGQRIRMLSPGSTCMQDCSESPEKFFFVVGRDDVSQEICYEPQPIETRGFIDLKVHTQEMLDALCSGQLATLIEMLPTRAGDIAKPIVRIKFDKALPDAFLRLTMTAGDSCHLFCEALAEKRGEGGKATSRASTRNELLSVLAELLGEDSQEYKLAAALVSAEEPSKALEEVFTAFFTEETDNAAATA